MGSSSRNVRSMVFAPSLPPVRPERGRVLVVDDGLFQRRSLAALLAQDSLECDCVADVEAALAALRDRAYDVVLLDLELGDRSGLEVLAAMRSRPELATTPAIMVTASRPSPQAIAAALHAGAHDYVTCPYEPEILRARVEAARRTGAALVAARSSVRVAVPRVEVEILELAPDTAPDTEADPSVMPQRLGSAAINAVSVSRFPAPSEVCLSLTDRAGRTVTLLIDVTGHGAAAAAAASVARGAADAALRAGADLEGTYHAISTALAGLDSGETMAAVGLVRLDEFGFEILNAGLPPIALFDGMGGAVRLFDSVAPPAGLGSFDVEERIARGHLWPGYAIAMVSDGALAGARDRVSMQQLVDRFGVGRHAAALAVADQSFLATLLREHASALGEGASADASFVIVAHDESVAPWPER